jgi:SPP1 gp7 family putative phage head morphogenesis protein
MPTDKQQKLIEEILADRQEAIAAALVEEAEAVATAAATSTLSQLSRMQRTKWTRATVEGITKAQVAAYRAQVARGGTDIVDKVVKDLGNGKVSVTTERVFKPWLNDMAIRDSEEILRIIGEGQRGGMHPKQIARGLRDYFDGTQHNALTAARTEAQKIRTDARFATYAKAGVHYVQYVTAGDGEVRPDHASRDGKIYKIQDAPDLGEPNCRCSLIDADFAVEERGMPVEGDGAIIVSAEELAA